MSRTIVFPASTLAVVLATAAVVDSEVDHRCRIHKHFGCFHDYGGAGHPERRLLKALSFLLIKPMQFSFSSGFDPCSILSFCSLLCCPDLWRILCCAILILIRYVGLHCTMPCRQHHVQPCRSVAMQVRCHAGPLPSIARRRRRRVVPSA